MNQQQLFLEIKAELLKLEGELFKIAKDVYGVTRQRSTPEEIAERCATIELNNAFH